MPRQFKFAEDADQLPEFEIDYTKCRAEPSGDDEKTIKYTIALYREPFAKFLTIIVPVLFTNLMAIFGMCIPLGKDYVADRLNHCVTVALALFAFLAYEHEMLPDVHYELFVDELNTMALLIVFVAAFETIIWQAARWLEDEGSFEMEDDEAETHMQIKILRYTMLSVNVFIFSIGFCKIMYRALKYAKERDNKFKSDNKKMKQAQTGKIGEDFSHEEWHEYNSIPLKEEAHDTALWQCLSVLPGLLYCWGCRPWRQKSRKLCEEHVKESANSKRLHDMKSEHILLVVAAVVALVVVIAVLANEDSSGDNPTKAPTNVTV
mmetsp:Transcript_79659/g.227424  ORF Transcript_79659/g.227424 Transcript_79659/m.227424 type:complete len:320 (+) Transcript_79659:492-1451(+)